MKHNTWISGLLAVAVLGLAGTGFAQGGIERMEPQKQQIHKSDSGASQAASGDKAQGQGTMDQTRKMDQTRSRTDAAGTQAQAKDQTRKMDQTRARTDASGSQGQAKDQTRATARLRQELKSQSQAGGDAVREKRQGQGEGKAGSAGHAGKGQGAGNAGQAGAQQREHAMDMAEHRAERKGSGSGSGSGAGNGGRHGQQ